jgi:hypothetical protein
VKPGKASRTAIAAAAARAAHLHIGNGVHIHVDTFAGRLIGVEDPDELREAMRKWNTPDPARVCVTPLHAWQLISALV